MSNKFYNIWILLFRVYYNRSAIIQQLLYVKHLQNDYIIKIRIFSSKNISNTFYQDKYHFRKLKYAIIEDCSFFLLMFLF